MLINGASLNLMMIRQSPEVAVAIVRDVVRQRFNFSHSANGFVVTVPGGSTMPALLADAASALGDIIAITQEDISDGLKEPCCKRVPPCAPSPICSIAKGRQVLILAEWLIRGAIDTFPPLLIILIDPVHTASVVPMMEAVFSILRDPVQRPSIGPSALLAEANALAKANFEPPVGAIPVDDRNAMRDALVTLGGHFGINLVEGP